MAKLAWVYLPRFNGNLKDLNKNIGIPCCKANFDKCGMSDFNVSSHRTNTGNSYIN